MAENDELYNALLSLGIGTGMQAFGLNDPGT
jgi:hypothetical protein